MKKYDQRGRTKGWLKAVFVIEFAAFAGSYMLWLRLCNNQEFRYTCHNKFPKVLNGFYWVLETMESSSTHRKKDYETWGISESKAKP